MNKNVIIRQIQVKDVMTKSNTPIGGYCVNPYVGCTHGCKYCYASFMKRFTGHTEEWGTFLDVKNWQPIKNLDKFKGEHIIIRGENGSGKSTLLKVIAKILDIDSGQITYGLPSIDGIMYVSQNTNLFNRSIYENIIYPMDDANLEEVYELINIFGLNSLITSENDLFQKKPGDFGNKFSGGEKQKILIIRTLINRPHIILFDEITSSLDSNSTKVFYEMLNTRLSSSTVLFVSHDDVVDSAFDRVLEIDELHAL